MFDYVVDLHLYQRSLCFVPDRPLSFSAASVLRAIADGVRYGFDIMDRTQLPSGTVYPALSRLERDGFVKSHWEDLQKAHDDRRPPRRYYRITTEGERALQRAIERFQTLQPLRVSGLKPVRASDSPRPARSRA
jgi:DNA-binding PadR family transcriptional regulator